MFRVSRLEAGEILNFMWCVLILAAGFWLFNFGLSQRCSVGSILFHSFHWRHLKTSEDIWRLEYDEKMDEHERRMDEHARLCSCLEWPLFTPGFQPGVGSPRGSKLEKSLESTRGLSCPGGIGGCWLQRHAPVAQQKPPETHGLRRLRAE